MKNKTILIEGVHDYPTETYQARFSHCKIPFFRAYTQNYDGYLVLFITDPRRKDRCGQVCGVVETKREARKGIYELVKEIAQKYARNRHQIEDRSKIRKQWVFLGDSFEQWGLKRG